MQGSKIENRDSTRSWWWVWRCGNNCSRNVRIASKTYLTSNETEGLLQLLFCYRTKGLQLARPEQQQRNKGLNEIYSRKINQHDALFFTICFYHTSACFGPICSPSSGGQVNNVAVALVLFLRPLSAGPHTKHSWENSWKHPVRRKTKRWEDMLSGCLVLKLQENIPDLIYHQEGARPPLHNEATSYLTWSPV
jgi:hypothetical protein